MNRSDFYPVAMTIAGSDSGGGAGIQADLRTFAALGVYGCSAITALTAQNPFGVAGIQPADPENLKMQIQAVLAEFDVRAIKTGMLFSDGLIRVVAECLKGWNGMLIVDPVMISTSGVPLLKEEAVETLMAELLPRAVVVTPNRMEAERIAGMSIRSLQEMERAARIGDGEEWLVNRLLVPVRRNVCQALAMKRYKPGSKKTEKAFPFDELKAGAIEELINEMPF